MTVAVTGATGTIGGELVRILSARGEAVRALTREPGGREPLEGVEWTRADLADPESLPGSLEGARALFLLTGNSEDMVLLQKNALRAAARAGIRRIVKLSALGATDHSKSVIGLWHYNVERRLRESTSAWTILRPHHFMQNLLEEHVFDRTAGRVYSASGEGKIPFIDTRDIAEAAAVVLTEEGHEEKVYTLTGPEAISYREATAVLSEELDRSLTFVAQTVDEAWEWHRKAGRPPWLVAAQLAIAGYQRAGGPTVRVTETVEALTGRAPRTLTRFVRDHREELEV